MDQGQKRKMDETSKPQAPRWGSSASSSLRDMLEPRYRQYNDQNYRPFDRSTSVLVPKLSPHVVNSPGGLVNFEIFNDFYLYFSNENEAVDQIPQHGVRIDDLAISRVVYNFTKPDLASHWPAEFNSKGMLRRNRTPLRHPAKVKVLVGERDILERIVQDGEEGYYYKWWRGVEMLCGSEGLELHRNRPFGSTPRIEGWGFLKGYKALVQLPDFHPDSARLPRSLAEIQQEEGGGEGKGEENAEGGDEDAEGKIGDLESNEEVPPGKEENAEGEKEDAGDEKEDAKGEH